ncbi:MAG: glycosyltransferase family 39 protein [Candidatus Microgenomates bacterium]|jgi:predicted membrane-bound dolichyl-phosphate-mannose-protein mannosyltransferase
MKEKIKAKPRNFFIPNIVYVLVIGLIVRFILSFFGTLHLDQGTFIAWSTSLANYGLKSFYNSWSDYLPGYLYFLWLLGKINVLGIFPQVVLYKIPATLSDLLTGLFIYKILKKSKGERWGIIGACIYIFNPAILANSALWGQVDSLTALTSVLAVYLMDTSYLASAAILSLGTLIKPQTAFILPVILFVMIRDKWKFSKFLIYSLTSLAVFIIGFVPFWNSGNLIGFIFSRLGISLNQYPYTSLNAFNFWSLFGFWKPDNIYFQLFGYLVVLGVTVLLCFKLSKIKNAPYYLIAFVFASSFMFFTRMHERHLLPVFAPLAIIAVENPLFLIPYIGFSVTYSANLYYSYIWITDNFKEVFSYMVVKFFAVVNISFVIYIFYLAYKGLKSEWSKMFAAINRFIDSRNKPTVKTEEVIPKIHLSKQKARIFLIIVLAFAFITRVFNLSSPSTMYFDEVYHAFTAKVIMGPDAAKAWEWWNTPPPGFAYEWTHPPLAKLGMVLGMTIFGQNSFGWRIPGALLGVGSVFLVYFLGKEIFDDEAIGLLSAGIFSLDGLALVMSRIGMNDSYILFFALLSIYLFMKKHDFWSAISLGLALASKWSAVWAIPILGVLWLWRKKKFTKSILWFLILPAAVYLLSYTDMFLTGHNLTVWWGMQEQMWWYHTGLRATHPYSSLWWSWPFLIRPIYLYTSDEVSGMVARIYAFGNPLVFWFGFASVVVSAMVAFVERNKKLGLVVFSYLVMFVPWALSPRIMFLYHYLPAIPFLTIATGYILRRTPKLIIPFFVAGGLLFIYFYPHWAGLSIPLWLDKSYYWFSSWR